MQTFSNHIFGVPGNEAIDFQVSSNLKKKMVEVFQMGIDFRDNLDYSRIPDVESSRKEYRDREVYNYVKNKVLPRFADVVKAETGMVIKRFYVLGGVGVDPCGMFAVNLSMDDAAAAVETYGRITGTDNYEYSNDREAVEEMKQMANLWESSGKVRKSTYAKNRKIEVDMYFDVNTAYLANDFYPDITAEPLTAAEIAAIMCHECGHVNSVIEHSADLYATCIRQQEYIKKLKMRSDPGEFMEYFQGLIPFLQKQSKVKCGYAALDEFNKRTCNTLVTGIQNVSKIYTDNPGSENFIYTTLNFAFNIFCMIGGFFLTFILNYVYIVMAMWIWQSLARFAVSIPSGSGNTKMSDFGEMYNNGFLMERWADEYAVRVGFGSELASGLRKIIDYSKYNQMGTIGSSVLRRSTFFGAIAKGYSWIIDKVSLFAYLDPIGYEDTYARIKRMKQDALAIFKDPNIPGAAADLWINTIENIEAQMRQVKTISDTAIAKRCYGIMKNFLDPVQIGVLIANGDLYNDLSRLSDNLDDLKTNALYYQSTKLKRAN